MRLIAEIRSFEGPEVPLWNGDMMSTRESTFRLFDCPNTSVDQLRRTLKSLEHAHRALTTLIHSKSQAGRL